MKKQIPQVPQDKTSELQLDNIAELEDSLVDVSMAKPLQSTIRIVVDGLYAMQDRRVAIGNQIIAVFKAKIGIKPGQSEESFKQEEADLLKNLREEYRTLSEGVVKNTDTNGTFKVPGKSLKFISEGYIDSVAEFALIQTYEMFCLAENTLEMAVKDELTSLPIYNRYLSNITGCGTKMSGVIVAYVDIVKCASSAALIKYAGLDVVDVVDTETPFDLQSMDEGTKLVNIPDQYGNETDHYEVVDLFSETVYDDNSEPMIVYHLLNEIGDKKLDRNNEVMYVTRTFKKEGRCRKASHLVPRTYVKATGEITYTRGLSHNPVFKAKMVKVLAECLIKQNPYYKKVYDDYKNRLRNMSFHGGKSNGHTHAMARRYMIKRFLIDLWMIWREIAGLPVVPPYEVAKLGHVHSGELHIDYLKRTLKEKEDRQNALASMSKKELLEHKEKEKGKKKEAKIARDAGKEVRRSVAERLYGKKKEKRE